MSTAQFTVRCLVLTIASAALAIMPATVLAIDPHGAPAKDLRGLSVWIGDDNVWHMATHTATVANKHVFTGTIRVVGAKIRGALGIDKLEQGDYWRIDVDKEHVKFRLTTLGKWDRIDLVLSGRADKLIFDVKEDGEDMKSGRIHIGKENKNPKGSRFTLPGK
jgi:hypothetical protein